MWAHPASIDATVMMNSFGAEHDGDGLDDGAD
jgi:hypothetical protein